MLGKADLFDSVDPDLMSHFELLDALNKILVLAASPVYYRIGGVDLENGLRLVDSDQTVLEMFEMNRERSTIELKRDGNDLYDSDFEFFLDGDDVNDGCDPVSEEEVIEEELIDTIENKFLGIKLRFCVRHMYANFKLKFKDEQLRDLMWSAARSYLPKQFENNTREIHVVSPDAHAWLRAIPTNLPKKMRRKGPDEDRHFGKVTKIGIPIHCSHYGHTDHNVPTTNMQTEQEAPTRGAARGDTHAGRSTRGVATVGRPTRDTTRGAGNSGVGRDVGFVKISTIGGGASTVQGKRENVRAELQIMAHYVALGHGMVWEYQIWTTSKQTSLRPVENPVGDTSKPPATTFDDNPTPAIMVKKISASKKRIAIATGTWLAFRSFWNINKVKTKYTKFGDSMFSTQSSATGASDVVQIPECVIQ
ncbi:hypothetical protein ACH5RR_008057 [Cinchona calisaya]|uniref:PB1-like domain-containing protein n=1 Tax=Cinchona calisaya TaxID=153742 RepID=A0ABD3AE59_9GENT